MFGVACLPGSVARRIGICNYFKINGQIYPSPGGPLNADQITGSNTGFSQIQDNKPNQNADK